MPWKVRLGLLLFFIGFPVYLATGVYVLRDDTCSIDKVSLEKRCQKAIDHYKGRQVNYEIR